MTWHDMSCWHAMTYPIGYTCTSHAMCCYPIAIDRVMATRFHAAMFHSRKPSITNYTRHMHMIREHDMHIRYVDAHTLTCPHTCLIPYHRILSPVPHMFPSSYWIVPLRVDPPPICRMISIPTDHRVQLRHREDRSHDTDNAER